MRAVQPPILSVVSSRSAPAEVATAADEGSALQAAAEDLRRIALTMPKGSSVRDELLDDAALYQARARLRGVHGRPSQAQSQSA